MAKASHDLRQPLLALRTSATTLVSLLRPDPAVLGRLENSLAYMLSLVDEALAARAPPRTVSSPYGYCPISRLTGAVVEMFEQQARAKGVRLRSVRTSVMTALPVASLMRILSNLVANAVTYTERGGAAIGCKLYDGRPWLVVVDTGPGIECARDRVCDRAVELQAIARRRSDERPFRRTFEVTPTETSAPLRHTRHPRSSVAGRGMCADRQANHGCRGCEPIEVLSFYCRPCRSHDGCDQNATHDLRLLELRVTGGYQHVVYWLGTIDSTPP